MKTLIAVVLLLTLLGVLGCTEFNPVMPQAEWDATATARGEASLVPTVTPEPGGDSRPVPEPEPAVAPDATAIAITEEEAEQVACNIKVNVSRDDIVYHLPGGAYYDRIKVDLSQGDFWACDEAEAIAAGARKSTR